MKCINKIKKHTAVCVCLLSCIIFLGCSSKNEPIPYAAIYEKTNYAQELYQEKPFAEDLCVAAQNVDLSGYTGDYSVHAAGLFDLEQKEVLYGDRIHERLFPASTTKILTAYVALKYGNLDDVVTVSETATTFEPDASLCGLAPGDQITLYDLICGLTLASGNDAGVAIAEHISGSVEAFADKMNEEARALGATNSHFVNPHGLHDDNHYTTAYDLYLMFQAAIQDPRYLEIISMKGYEGTITGDDGQVRTLYWAATNYYSAGEVAAPDGVRVFGGKTGTTDEAGSCVILYDEDLSGHPYISIIMGAVDKTSLYQDMSSLLDTGITH
mgnify:CR=1 FL=1